jgi:hypothetical protein
MIAFNQSAVASYSTAIMHTPPVANLANPEVLAAALDDFVHLLRLRPTLRGARSRPLVEQAIKRN